LPAAVVFAVECVHGVDGDCRQFGEYGDDATIADGIAFAVWIKGSDPGSDAGFDHVGGNECPAGQAKFAVKFLQGCGGVGVE
jgi:hypothetical protein